jgi:hypothetical protein
LGVQVCPAPQPPQVIAGQPGAVNDPQAPAGHVVGQLETQAVPAALQVWPVGQPGAHVIVPPQLSEAVPQICPDGQLVAFVQPQTFGLLGVPPPQVLGEVQAPQFTVPPQLFGIVPQLSGVGQLVSGLHTQVPGLPLQTFGAVQEPQLMGAQPAIPGSNVPQVSPVGQVVGQTVVHAVPAALQT